MTGFEDDQGRHWEPRVTTLTLLRLRQETGVSLFKRLREAAQSVRDAKAGKSEEEADKLEQEAAAAAFSDLFQDEAIMYALVYLTVEVQARDRTVDRDGLLTALSSNALMMAAVSAVQEAISGFFQRPGEDEENTAEQKSEPGHGS